MFRSYRIRFSFKHFLKKASILSAFLLCVGLTASSLYADDVKIYLYDEEVSSQVNVGKYLSEGDVQILGGTSVASEATLGPAPPPYPAIHVWEKGVEQLGKSSNRVDGIRFFHFGRYWKKNRRVFVLWKIHIPSASLRKADEFEQDLSLSLWVDWNQDEMWDKNERMSHKQINISRFFPTSVETKCIYYLTWFRIPDIEDHMFSSRWDTRDLVNLWVRGVLSYDDPDASPDGNLLFGEAEDYQVIYRKK